MSRRRALLAACALAALAGCGGGGGGDSGPAVTTQERRVGAEQHPRLLAEFGGAYRSDEAAYLERLGGRIAATAGLEGQCTFTLINSDVVNAFAVPGCFIYVTRGLMGIVNSEAELASVLAHEVGHIVGNHAERQQKRSIWRSLGVAAVSVLTGSDRLANLAGNAAAFFGLRYSRAQEYEADDLGLSYLRGAGYDPYAAADMLDALGRNEAFEARTRGHDEARSIPEWARTHPLTQNRIARARDAAAESGAGPDELPENELAYLRAVDGLLYGDDPEQGFVLGRAFAHPVMRIAFEAPSGFTLTNSPQAIMINGPDGQRGEFAGGPLPPGGLEDYAATLLSRILGEAQARAGAAQRAVVNGVPAVFVPAEVATEQGAVPLSLAVYAGPGGGAFHFLMVSKPGVAPAPAIRDLFGSFRLLSPAEAAQLRPRRIRVVTPGPNDSLQGLASLMASENPLDHFLMLNGRSAGQPLRPGEPVKIVTVTGR
jgi:predicted Zn-dependent protease